jgi:hypothetical protein
VFQAVVLDPVSGELRESRFTPSRETLADWAMQWQGKLAAVAIEATTGWRWVARELQAQGFEVHYTRHRPHRSLSLQPPDQQPAAALPLPAWRINKRELLGGLINDYKAAA